MFSRTLANQAKMGAYYTDVDHCRRIGQLFAFPQEEVCVLEPSIGDASAVNAVTAGCEKRKLFGVELNPQTVEELKEKNACDYLLHADFLNGVKISNKAFSFVFANPPYGENKDKKERLELMFLEKIVKYICADGILVYIIPYYVLTDEKFMKAYMHTFNPYAVFRFDDNEYKKYQQIVLIGGKRKSFGYMAKWMERFKEMTASLDEMAYLPKMGEEIQRKIQVLPSSESKVEYFTTLEFDAKAAGEYLAQSSLYSLVAEKAFIPEFQATKLGSPPTPLKKDLLYLCSIAGCGQGIVGSEDEKDLHLQRGSAKVVKTVTPKVDEKGNSILVESSFTKIMLTIIENTGEITVLE